MSIYTHLCICICYVDSRCIKMPRLENANKSVTRPTRSFDSFLNRIRKLNLWDLVDQLHLPCYMVYTPKHAIHIICYNIVYYIIYCIILYYMILYIHLYIYTRIYA